MEPAGNQRVFYCAARRKIIQRQFWIILGSIPTVSGSYLCDTLNASAVVAQPVSAQRPRVNCAVVNVNWQHLTISARSEWNRVTANIDAKCAVRPVEPRG